MITVDTNSGEDAVYQSLEAECGASVQIRRQRLDVGDVFVHAHDTSLGSEEGAGDSCVKEFAHGICVERKTWADLCASIVDGRLAEQKSRMVEPNVRYVYAIECPTIDPWDGFYRGSMRNKCMWGALVKMQLRDGC